ncbi:MAG: endolytic transglycosylase MltG [Oscillospiraceae bacterium]|nr:endolytic transglycosylase MltG [Oscillospiraceae bacterium]
MLSKKIWVALRVLVIILLLFGFAVLGVFGGFNYVLSQDTRFDNLKKGLAEGKYKVQADTPGAVTLVVETGDSTSDIADKLLEKGLIKNKLVFSLMSKINGFDGAYVAGTHYLLDSYSYDELMFFLTLESATVAVTIPEGTTYYKLKKILHKAGLTFDDAEFDMCMNSPDMFVDYDFVSKIEINDERDFILAGYLYPDTYMFDVNSKPETIIRKFLNNMKSKLYDEYYTRAKGLGMSMDQVITLASVIQMETGKPLDMMYISAVFHNRLKSKDKSLRKFGSSASINYLIEQRGEKTTLLHTDEQLKIDSPYNTYTHEGLPPGPICMPGLDAISAALYPEPGCGYLYFCATGDGGTAFATNLKQHNKNIAKYKSNWTKHEDVTEEEPHGEDLDDENIGKHTGDETTPAETTKKN